MAANSASTIGLRRYSGACHNSTTHTSTETEFGHTKKPIYDLFVRVIQNYASAANDKARSRTALVSFDTWCTEHECRSNLLFWLCVERFQNRDWKPITTLKGGFVPIGDEATQLFNDFMDEGADYRIVVTLQECGRVRAVLGSPTRDMFRTFQSQVFSDMIEHEFKQFWDANPTLHTTLDPSGGATSGNVVMACHTFLQEYYDFGFDFSLPLDSSQTSAPGTWERISGSIIKLCSTTSESSTPNEFAVETERF